VGIISTMGAGRGGIRYEVGVRGDEASGVRGRGAGTGRWGGGQHTWLGC
jgi:hypothetical protein